MQRKGKMEFTLFSFAVHGAVHRYCIPSSATNKMQRYTVFFIAVSALPLVWVSWHCQLTHASGSSKQA
jgi:hypothetical protein